MTEPEIWYILDSLVKAARLFEKNGYYHGDIQPDTCFLADNGDLKLIDNWLMNFSNTGYYRMCYGDDYKTILSPQLLHAYKDRQMNPVFDAWQNEVNFYFRSQKKFQMIKFYIIDYNNLYR